MPLQVPPRSGDDSQDLETLYQYLFRQNAYFPQLVGEAVDPDNGQGGDAALNIDSPPTGISYTSGTSVGVDETLYGHIDILFTLPSRAVSVVVYYREVGVENFKTSTAPASPWRLPNLKVGIEYELKLAGLAANGRIGPESDLTTVTIDISDLDALAVDDLAIFPTYQGNVLTWTRPSAVFQKDFLIERARSADFTTDLVELAETPANYFLDQVAISGTVYWYRIRSQSVGGAISVDSNVVSSPTGPLISDTSNIVSETTPFSFTGQGVIEVFNHVVFIIHNLNKTVKVFPEIFVTADTPTARIMGVFVTVDTLTSFRVTITGFFNSSTDTITGNLVSYYF